MYDDLQVVSFCCLISKYVRGTLGWHDKQCSEWSLETLLYMLQPFCSADNLVPSHVRASALAIPSAWKSLTCIFTRLVSASYLGPSSNIPSQERLFWSYWCCHLLLGHLQTKNGFYVFKCGDGGGLKGKILLMTCENHMNANFSVHK